MTKQDNLLCKVLKKYIFHYDCLQFCKLTYLWLLASETAAKQITFLEHFQCFPMLLATFSTVILDHFPGNFLYGYLSENWGTWKTCRICNLYGLQHGMSGKRTMLATLIILGTKILSLPSIFSWLDPIFPSLHFPKGLHLGKMM